MHRVAVVIFEDETKAEQARSELLRLDNEGSIGIYGYEVVAKKADGAVVVMQPYSGGTLSPYAKALLGSLGDSTRLTMDVEVSLPGESPVDSKKIESGKDLIREMRDVLLPNRVAIVAEIEEEWTTGLDTHMGSLGGVVFRWTVSEVPHAIEM
jgi:hypothetical protein